MDKKFEIFGKFTFRNKIFFIILEERSKIIFACYEKGKISLKLTSEEVDVISKVYNTVLINQEKSILVDKTIVNGTTYNIFFDTMSKNYFWKDLYGNCIDKPQDNIILNFKYNIRPTKVYYRRKKSSDEEIQKRMYPRAVKIGNTMLALFCSAEIALLTLVGIPVVNLAYKEWQGLNSTRTESVATKELESAHEENSIYPQVEEIGEQNTDLPDEKKYSFDEIKQILENNPNIDKETKQFLYKLQFVFDENYEYMDLESITERLRTLKITYTQEPGTEDYMTGGMFDKINNEITIYRNKKFNIKDERCVETVIHEFLHVLQGDYIHRYLYILELSNQLLTEETLRQLADEGVIEHDGGFGGYGTGYQHDLYLYKYIASIISREALKRYQFTLDDSQIWHSLAKHEGDTSEAKTRVRNLLEQFNTMRSNEDSLYGGGYGEHQEIIKNIDSFYKKVKGMGIEEDLNAQIIYNTFGTKADSALGRILLKAADLDFGKDSQFIHLNSMYALGPTYFSNHYNEEPIISFKLSVCIDGREDLESELPKERFMVKVTKEMCEEYRRVVREEKISNER